MSVFSIGLHPVLLLRRVRERERAYALEEDELMEALSVASKIPRQRRPRLKADDGQSGAFLG